VQHSTTLQKTIVIIGAGIGGLTTAAWLAKAGFRVIVFEKNASIGGRAASFRSNGFTFELGPTWYGDVQVMESFFTQFGHRSTDFYRLKPLKERYTVHFDDKTTITVPTNFEEVKAEFSAWEQSGAQALSHLVAQSTRLQTRIQHDLWSRQLTELRQWMQPHLWWSYAQICLRQSPNTTVEQSLKKVFARSYLRSVLLAPLIASGLVIEQTAALYTASYFAQLDQIPVYPLGGMGEVPKAIAQVGWERGVQTQTNAEVEQVLITDGKAVGVEVNGERVGADAVIIASDYQQAEQRLLATSWRTVAPSYWQQSTQSKTVYTIFLGLKEKLSGLGHHTYYMKSGLQQVNRDHGWISQPEFYCAIASQTDWQAAPKGGETLRLSVVLDPSLTDTLTMRQKYFNHLLDHFETVMKMSIRDKIVYQRVFSQQQYASEWSSAQAASLGLLPTPAQFLWRRPQAKSAKVAGLYYVGQTIDPGPGLAQVMAGAARVSQQVSNDVQ
jgi:phytoene desaturase